MDLKLTDLARLRLRVQRLALSGARFAKPEEVVGWLGAVQSQEYALAKWSLGQRLAQGPGAGVVSASSVESAIASGRIGPARTGPQPRAPPSWTAVSALAAPKRMDTRGHDPLHPVAELSQGGALVAKAVTPHRQPAPFAQRRVELGEAN